MYAYVFGSVLVFVLGWAVKIAIIKKSVNVTMMTIIVICSGIAAVVIIIVLRNAREKAVNRRALLE